ncbi:hypothetical protein HMPREF0208_01465 [Citrobacter koseri]|nr:hypothetical protein HMPREF0208_01465 [Citrobacter koseri]
MLFVSVQRQRGDFYGEEGWQKPPQSREWPDTLKSLNPYFWRCNPGMQCAIISL